jgi:hypothetical protein
MQRRTRSVSSGDRLNAHPRTATVHSDQLRHGHPTTAIKQLNPSAATHPCDLQHMV